MLNNYKTWRVTVENLDTFEVLEKDITCGSPDFAVRALKRIATKYFDFDLTKCLITCRISPK